MSLNILAWTIISAWAVALGWSVAGSIKENPGEWLLLASGLGFMGAVLALLWAIFRLGGAA